MRMGFNLQLEQSQKLVMTPQLQQAIKILQFTSLELDNYVTQEIEKNPVLELNDDKEKQEMSDITSKEDKLKEIDWKEYINDSHNYTHSKGVNHNDDNDFNYENIVSKESTLHEYLLFQYHLTIIDKRYFKIGEYIINSLDDNGYLTATVEEISCYFKEEENIVKNILSIIQTFDPPGVGARNLQECLLLQLKFLEIDDKKIYELVEEYLDKVGANKYPYIAKKLGVTVKKVQDYCDFIKTLDPKPGRRFASNQNKYITPDIVVKKIGNEYVLTTNDYSEPRLSIRKDYKIMMDSNDKESDVVKFLSDQFNSAAWLIKSIEQRKQTIYKVAESIVKKQFDFFEKGKKHLKPMTLKEVAEDIEMHESTVSRATNGKYIETPLGTFELKYFFSGGLDNKEGMGISTQSVKSFIRDIINEENPKKPLSDDKIVKILKDKGINISRRTVAKYRDEMGILSSSKRKRY